MGPPKITDIQSEMNIMKDEILNKIEQLHNDITGIRQDMAKIAENTGEIDNLKEDIRELRTENDTLKKNYDYLKEKLISMESYNRRENLIFQGVPVSKDENCLEKVKNIMKNKMHLHNDFVESIKVQRCHRLYEHQKKTNKIIIRFLWFPDRETVWSARFKLAKSGYFLLEDFPQEIMNRRQSLIPILKRAKQLKKKCTMIQDKLIIEGKTFTFDNLKSLPQELNPAEAATRRSEEITAFFSEACPLSNFYRTPITIENNVYHSVEQYLQLQKAIFAEDVIAAAAIRKTKHPVECKRIAKDVNINNQQDWLQVAKDAVRRACTAKFTSNVVAKEFLLSTIGTTIAEASYDKIWGVGINLSDEKVFRKDDWTGMNLLGQILQEVREIIS